MFVGDGKGRYAHYPTPPLPDSYCGPLVTRPAPPPLSRAGPRHAAPGSSETSSALPAPAPARTTAAPRDNYLLL